MHSAAPQRESETATTLGSSATGTPPRVDLTPRAADNMRKPSTTDRSRGALEHPERARPDACMYCYSPGMSRNVGRDLVKDARVDRPEIGKIETPANIRP